MEKAVNLLGIRGLPAAHGGFETFAHHLAPYLVNMGWKVTVYCQHDRDDVHAPPHLSEDDWNGVRRIHIQVGGKGAYSTILFDFHATRHVLKQSGVDLVLGYNTAIFALMQRFYRRKIAINMDGVEWRRDKWRLPAKIWFYVNEFIGYHVASVPVADHPEIAAHLRRHGRRNTTVIPYGSAKLDDVAADRITKYGIRPSGYFLSIARIEPENSILEIVKAFSSKPRQQKLVVLGKLEDDNYYHKKILEAASNEVVFLGAIYDKAEVQALRFHARAYLHGHQVGGTNPSLVEALGAGNPIIAHSNRFNRWVAGKEQFYFKNSTELADIISSIDYGSASLESTKRAASARHAEAFTFDIIHNAYRELLENLIAVR